MLMYVLVEFIGGKFGVSTSEGVFLPTLTAGNVLLVLYTLEVVGVTPIVEEVFWRMHFQGCLQRLFNVPVAIWVQSVLFAAVHMRGIAGSLEVFLIGVIYGVWRWRRGAVIPLIVAHIILNSIACVGYWRDEWELRMVTMQEDYRIPLEMMCTPTDYVPRDNAANDYERAFESFIGLPKGLDEADLDTWPTQLPPKKVTLVRNWLASNQDAMARLGRAAAKSYYCPAYATMPVELIMHPSLSGLRGVVLATLSRAQVSAFDHSLSQSVADITTCFRVSQHLAGPKPLIEQIMGVAIQQQTSKTVMRILTHGKMTGPDLWQLQSALELVSVEYGPVISFSGERLICHALIQKTFTDELNGGGHVPRAFIRCIMNPPSPIRRLCGLSRRDDASKWKKLGRRQTERLTDELFTCLSSIEICTPVEVRQRGADVQTALQRIAGDNAFLCEFIPGYAKAYHSAYRSRSLMNSLILIAAILRYQVECGDPPDDLSQIVQGGYVDVLPEDPYSGSSFIYRRTSQDFVLYGVGADFDDDGGVKEDGRSRESDADEVFWPPSDR
jgi:hypothetical protein